MCVLNMKFSKKPTLLISKIQLVLKRIEKALT